MKPSEGRVVRALAAVVLAGLGVTRSAGALSCARDEELRLPRDGQREVPLDTLIWGGWPGAQVSLRGPEGVVASERRLIPAAGYAQRNSGIPVLVPLQPLQPNSVYTVEESAGPNLSRQFTTGESVDDEAPAPLKLLGSTASPGQLVLDFASDDVLAGELDGTSAPFASLHDVLLPVNFGDGYRALDADAPVFQWLTPEPTLRLSSGGVCSNWSSAGYAQRARFGTFDIAGNFSGWTDVPDIEVPPAPEVRELVDADVALPRPAPERAEGCSVGAPASASTASRWAGLLAVLMGLGLRAFFDAPRPGETASYRARRRGCLLSRRER